MDMGKQCNEIGSKANKILSMIKCTFSDRTKETILPLYKKFRDRAHLEYCSQIWILHYP